MKVDIRLDELSELRESEVRAVAQWKDWRTRQIESAARIAALESELGELRTASAAIGTAFSAADNDAAALRSENERLLGAVKDALAVSFCIEMLPPGNAYDALDAAFKKLEAALDAIAATEWLESPTSGGWWEWREGGGDAAVKVLLTGDGLHVADDDTWAQVTGHSPKHDGWDKNYWEGSATAAMPGLWRAQAAPEALAAESQSQTNSNQIGTSAEAVAAPVNPCPKCGTYFCKKHAIAPAAAETNLERAPMAVAAGEVFARSSAEMGEAAALETQPVAPPKGDEPEWVVAEFRGQWFVEDAEGNAIGYGASEVAAKQIAAALNAQAAVSEQVRWIGFNKWAETLPEGIKPGPHISNFAAAVRQNAKRMAAELAQANLSIDHLNAMTAIDKKQLASLESELAEVAIERNRGAQFITNAYLEIESLKTKLTAAEQGKAGAK